MEKMDDLRWQRGFIIGPVLTCSFMVFLSDPANNRQMKIWQCYPGREFISMIQPLDGPEARPEH